MFITGGSTTYTQTFCRYTGIEHLTWYVAIPVWQPSNIKTKLVSFVKKSCGEDTTFNFDAEIQKVSTTVVVIFLVERELRGIDFMIMVFKRMTIVKSQEIVDITKNLTKLTS